METKQGAIKGYMGVAGKEGSNRSRKAGGTCKDKGRPPSSPICLPWLQMVSEVTLSGVSCEENGCFRRIRCQNSGVALM